MYALSFAFSILTNYAVIRQFSTHLFQPVEPNIAPIKKRFYHNQEVKQLYLQSISYQQICSM
jgi:hypothetical protein